MALRLLNNNAIFILLLASFSSAQTGYSINSDSVPLSTRDAWCESQIAQCPLICADKTQSMECESNQCAASTLTYTCICDNGMSPNISQYSLTIPFYICQEWGNQCVAACGNDASCASECRDKHPCGAQDPTRTKHTTTSATHAAPTKSQTAYTGFADGASSGASSFRYDGFQGLAHTFGLVAFMGLSIGMFAFGL